MKKKYFLPLLSVTALVLIVVFGLKPSLTPIPAPTPTGTEKPNEIITLTAANQNDTPFSLLTDYSNQKSIVLKVKVYDFGTLVEGIGDKLNSNDLSWIYFVNGVSGDMAADKKPLKAGDKVEWKFIKPEF